MPKIVLSLLVCLILFTNGSAQDFLKGTIFELVNTKEGDSVYLQWTAAYQWTQSGGGSEKRLVGRLKDKKNAKWEVVLNLYQGKVAAVTVMKFKKNKYYGEYKGALPPGLKWGEDWEAIKGKSSLQGNKSFRGVQGVKNDYIFLLGFEEIDDSEAVNVQNQTIYEKLIMRKMNRITFNNRTGPQYLDAF